MSDLRAELLAIVRDGVSGLDRRLRLGAIDQVVDRAMETPIEGPLTPSRVVVALGHAVERAAADIERIEADSARLMIAYQGAKSESKRLEVVTAALRARGGKRSDLRADLAATRRWLDLEALQERLAADIADRIDRIDVAYQAMGRVVSDAGDLAVLGAAKSGNVLATASELAAPGRKPAMRASAIRFLVRCAARAPEEERLSLVGLGVARAAQSWARGEKTTRWAQVAAMELVAYVAPDEAHLHMRALLLDRKSKDGMIIRRNALRIVGAIARREQLTVALLAKDDPSEHVRQELARVLRSLASHEDMAARHALVELAKADTSPRVSGIALRELGAAAQQDESAREAAAEAIESGLADRARPLVVRVALEVLRSLGAGASPKVAPSRFVKALEALASDASVRQEIALDAAATLRWIEVETSGGLRSLRDDLAKALSPLLEGESTKVPVPSGAPPLFVERALAVAAHGDMTVSVRRSGSNEVVITRGEPRQLRLWRLIHEAKTPMPDKRKGYVHTRGRVPAGDTVIAPLGMAEVTPTRVPGERQLYSPLGGWGPYVPRVDDLLAVATPRARSLRIVSPFGTLIVEGPKDLRARLRAWWRLTWRYVPYAMARERSLSATEPVEKRAYARMVADLGFRCRLADTDGEAEGDRFAIRAPRPADFAAEEAPLLPPGALESVVAYFLARSSGTPTQLGLVAWVVLAAMILRGAWIMKRIEQSRAAIPLTIGGWGTRGKSGSERLKAALFHALRYDVVVKTTGCEAMFIHALRDMPAQEIFIYRPYDKATIWEQRNVLHVAKSLTAQVFLWECMALQPRFVDTLANEWMKDDVTTLTNAYPDHEDIQGPGGEDVARVIGRFMPVGGLTFTTEEQMLPLLADAARKKKTTLRVVPPIEADLLPLDLLDRLPYQEHPRNVAMVLALADHYGVDRELALVEIADHVIADLGVLKTYPTVEHRGRKLTFSNGMSANERAGFMSNWVRLAFDQNDVDAEPDVAVCAVVNNRADRVARSRVFAQILVDDAPCDHVVLINTNLGGMMQFIEEALDKKVAEMRVTGDGGTERALERFDAAMRWVKVPSADDAMRERLGRMLRALPLDDEAADAVLATPEVDAAVKALSPDIGPALERALASHEPKGREDRRPDVVRHATRLAQRIARRRAAREEVAAALGRNAEEEANAAFRRAYRELFMDRIAVLWDAGATGDQVVDFMAREIPPGQRVRIMGTQNIKGTGLDFVYRWLSVDRVRANLERLRTEPHVRAEMLAFFGSYTDFGLVDVREALDELRKIREAREPSFAAHEAVLDSVIERLAALEKDKATKLVSTAKAGLGVRILNKLEAFVDHLDSVRRTNLAAMVMDDLFARRVGHGRAAILLRDVTGRSKGGWLAKDIAKWRQKK